MAESLQFERPLKALDLFCGAGGATRGLQMAGFHVTGVDIHLQPHYAGDTFYQSDALDFPLDGFDFIWASPPCQAYNDTKFLRPAKERPALIDLTRERLIHSGRLWVIENVEGAPLEIGPPQLFAPINGIVLCGSMFRLRTHEYELRRHRLFESNFPMRQPSCQHSNRTIVGFYGDHAFIRKRNPGKKHRGQQIDGDRKRTLLRDLMGIDWMTWKEAAQAIPPAYAEFIGREAFAGGGL